MLQSIHDKTSGWVAKVILGLIALVFVFFGVEMQTSMTSTYAAEVNGTEISLQSAQQAWQDRQNQLQQMFQGPIPDAVKKEQQKLVLDQLIRSQLLQERVEKLNLHVSDEMLSEAIQTAETLQVDGKFSQDRYNAFVQQQGMTVRAFEAQLRGQLETQQLQSGVRDTAFFTSGEAKRAQALLNEQREIDYVVLPAKSFEGSVSVTDADIQSWYDANKNQYLTPEAVDLQYVELRLSDVTGTIAVDDATLRSHYDQIKDRYSSTERRRAHHILIAIDKNVNEAAAKKQADEVLAKLKAGGDFEALAKQYSKDPGSASKGGDLGWATRGMFVGPFEQALFAMSAGQLSDPVKTEYGYHVIRLDEIEGGQTKSFDEVRAEVEADYRGERARTTFYEKTQKLADDAFSRLTELDSVAQDAGTVVKTIPGFTREGGGELGKEPQVIEAAFSESVLEKGENSPLVTIGEDRALVLRIANHREPQQKPLADVRDAIVSVLKTRAAQAAAEKKGAEVVAQLQAGTLKWDGVAKAASVAPQGKRWLPRAATEAPNEVVSAAFAAPKQDIGTDKPAFKGTTNAGGDYVVLAVSGVRSGAEAADAVTMARSLADQRAVQTGNAEFDAYVRELERKADIERNPAAFD